MKDAPLDEWEIVEADSKEQACKALLLRNFVVEIEE